MCTKQHWLLIYQHFCLGPPEAAQTSSSAHSRKTLILKKINVLPIILAIIGTFNAWKSSFQTQNDLKQMHECIILKENHLSYQEDILIWFFKILNRPLNCHTILEVCTNSIIKCCNKMRNFPLNYQKLNFIALKTFL